MASKNVQAVIWTTTRIPARLRSQLEPLGLMWRTGTHTRILCRAEIDLP